jgi:prepilin-type N-terminal cleavage/methylation domain-containing protein
MKQRFRTKGFTLIELMVVLTVIGILASVMLPSFMKSRNTALFTGCQANMRNVSASLENYWLDNDHKYPANLPVMYASQFGKRFWCPNDPAQGDYGYSLSSVDKLYTIYCMSRHLAGSTGGFLPAGFPQYEFGTGIVLP